MAGKWKLPQKSFVQQLVAQLPDDYPALLRRLKQRIKTAQIQAVLKVNNALIVLYWEIGKELLARQKQGREAQSDHLGQPGGTG